MNNPSGVPEMKVEEIVVYCHHGTRSAQVVVWLQKQGWSTVWNMAGGIEAYAKRVDPTIGFY